jgi:hypothetical protein
MYILYIGGREESLHLFNTPFIIYHFPVDNKNIDGMNPITPNYMMTPTDYYFLYDPNQLLFFI